VKHVAPANSYAGKFDGGVKDGAVKGDITISPAPGKADEGQLPALAFPVNYDPRMIYGTQSGRTSYRPAGRLRVRLQLRLLRRRLDPIFSSRCHSSTFAHRSPASQKLYH
jgi:hypothetical protein